MLKEDLFKIRSSLCDLKDSIERLKFYSVACHCINGNEVYYKDELKYDIETTLDTLLSDIWSGLDKNTSDSICIIADLDTVIQSIPDDESESMIDISDYLNEFDKEVPF